VTPPFQLVADGGVPADLLADPPEDMPMLIGTTRDEAWAFFPRAPADLTGRLFGDGSLRLARQGRSAFVFQFDWSPPGSSFGACPLHGTAVRVRRPGRLACSADAGQRRPRRPTAANGRGAARLEVFVHTGSPGWPSFPHVRHFA
jgi:para-nitrobenzyl esterase